MNKTKKKTRKMRVNPEDSKKFFWVLLVFVLIIGIWIGVQGANQGMLTLATSAQGLTNQDGAIKVRIRALDASKVNESLYTIDQTAVVKDGQLKLRWQIPGTAKKKAAYIEVCALDKRAGPSAAVKKACIEEAGDVGYNKVSCPYYVPANSTGFSGQLNGWNKLDDSQKVGCSGGRSFSKVSSVKALANAQSPGIEIEGGGVLVAKNGKIETKDVEQFVKDALSGSNNTTVQVTTNVPVPGPQGQAGANGANGADGAVGIATVSGGGLILTGTNLSLDDSCAAGELLKWDGSNWGCAVDGGGSSDSQTLSLLADVLSISGGNSVNLSGYLDNTDSQALSWVGGTRTLSLTGGGSVVISDSDTTYSAGNGLSLGGTTFSINSPTCAGTTKLTWNGTAFSCAADVDTDTDTTNFNIAANGGAGQNISSGDTVNFTNGTGTSASRTGNDISFGLANTSVTGGTYSPSNNANGSLALPQFTVDAQGRLTAASTTNVTLTGIANSQLTNSAITVNTAGPLAGGGAVSLGGSLNLSLDLSDSGDSATATTSSGSGLEVSGSEIGLLRGCGNTQLLKWNTGSLRWECASDTDTNSGGTVTSITAGTGLSGGVITTTGTIDIANTGVTAASYGSSTSIPVITVNAQGQITAASSSAIPTATTSTTGLLTDTDWDTFNGKENVLTFTGNGLFSRTGNTVTGLACSAGEIPKWTAGTFVCGSDIDTDTTYSAGNGLSLGGTTFSINSPTCAGTTKLTWNGTAFSCAADVDTDTDTTNFNVAAQGTVGSQNIASGDTVTFNNGTGTTATRSGSTVTYGLNNTAVTAASYAPSDNANGSLALPQFTVDAQGRLTAASTTNVTLTGIANSQLANSSLTVTAGSGLINGGAVSLGGTTTLDIGAGSGITVNANDITIDLTAATDGLSATTSSSSGLEVLGTGLTLLQGCSDTQLLKWNETTDVWACGSDTDTGVTSIGTIDSQTKSANGAVISGTSLVLQTADATSPGLVSAGTQTFAGAKTFIDDTTISSQSDSATAFQVQNSTAGLLFNVDAATSSTTIASPNNSTTALQVLNASGDQLMNIDTTNIVNNLIANSSFEVSDTGWNYNPGYVDTTQAYVGKSSLRVDAANTGDGSYYDVALASDTSYTLSFYAKAGSENDEGFASMYAGYYDGTSDTDCLTSQTVSTSGWTRYSCTFTTGTTSGTPNIYIRQNDSTTRAFYVDGVQLLENTLPSSIITGTNSTFESGVGSWSGYSGSGPTQSSAQAHMGTYSGRMITSGGGGENGVSLSVSGLVSPSTTYTIKAYIKADASSTQSTYQLGHTLDNGQVTTSRNGCNIVTPTSSTWKVLTCTFTTDSSLRASPYITLTQTNNLTTATTTYIDSISMYAGSDVYGTDQGFTMGRISLNGAIESPTLFQNASNSTTAFQIQGANSSNGLLVADTLNNRVAIGKNTAAYTLDVEGIINASSSVITPSLTSLAGTALTIDSGTTGALSIGTGANAKTITIGNGTGATSVEVNCGTGVCKFGTNATVHTTTLGSLTGASATVVQAGTGGLTLGSSGVANTIQIGNTTGAVSQTINIGNNATASSTSNVNIGSTVAGTTAIAGPTTITGRTSGSSSTLVVNNSTSTGAIFTAQDNGTAVLTIANNGGATFKTVSNTANAFKTTNSNNDVLLNVGTAQSIPDYTNLINNSSFESGSSGWTGKSGGTLGGGTGGGSVTGVSYMDITMDAVGEGAYYPVTLTANTDYTLSVYARTYWGAMNTLVMGHQDQSGTDIDDCILSSETIDTDWHRVSCTFTTGATISSSNVYIRQSDATFRSVQFDAVQLQAQGGLSAYNMGEVYFNAPINQNLIVTANGYSGTNDLTFQVQDTTGALQFGVSAGGQVTVTNGLAVNGGDLTSTATTFNFLSSNVTELNIGDAVGASGIDLAGGSGSTGCTIQGAVGSLTCSGNITSTATSGIQGWWTRSGTTLQPGNSGDNITTSGNITTTSTGSITSSGGLQVDGNTTLGDAATDTILAKGSMIANAAATGTTDTTSGTGTNTTTLTITGTAFANGDVILIDNAGQDYYTRVTAGGGTSSLTVSPAVTFETGRTVTKYNVQNIGATDSSYTTQSNRFFQGYFLGGVVTGAGSTTLSDGRLHSTAGLNFDAPSYTFANASNSTSAFRVNRADGENLVKFDTATTENLLSNGNFESNTTGWAAHGSSTVSQTGSQYYLGTGSMSVATTAAANDGAKFNYSLASQTTYTMTFYVKSSSLTTAVSTINIGRSEDGSTDSDCATAQTVNGGGWSKLTCTFTTGNVTGTDYVYLKQSDATARTLYIDSVELQSSGNLNTNPDVEVNTSGWSTYSSPTISQTTSQAYTGSGSLQVDTSLTGGYEGPVITPTTQPNTTYTASFWVQLDAGTSGSKTFQLYKRFDSTDGTSTSCTSATLSPGVWTNMTCTFTTGNVTAGSPYIGPVTIDDTVTPITFYVDNASVSVTKWNSNDIGRISLNGAIDSPLTVRGAQDSTSALQVQQQNGSNVLTVDTLNGRVGIGTASPTKTLEVNGKVVFRPTSTDTDSFQVTNTAILGTANSVIFNVAGSSRIVSAGLSTNTSNTSLNVYGTSLIKTVTSSGSASAFSVQDSSNANVLTVSTSTGNKLVYVGEGGIDAKFQVLNTSSTAVLDIDTASGGYFAAAFDQFIVQNSVGGGMIYADGVNNKIIFGDADDTSSANTALLIVDSASTANLPTGVNGGIVYDSQVGKFKIFEGGAYKTLCNTTDLACATSTSIGTIDSQTKSANGAVISGTSLVMQNADASFPGLVSTGSQAFAGAKTFNSTATFAGNIHTSNGIIQSTVADGAGANAFQFNTSNNYTTSGADLLVVSNWGVEKMSVDKDGNLNIASGAVYKINGTSGASTTCSGGQFLQDQVVLGGLTTGGTCNGTVVTSIGTINSQTKSANGAVISGNSLVMQTADTSFPGLVSTGTQTFTGNKTFNGDVEIFGSSINLGNNAADTITATANLRASNFATATTDTTSGTGTNTTTLTIVGTSFANNDVVLIDNAGQDYYTRVVSGGGTSTLTVSPAVTFETGRTVTKYTIQNIGATPTDYTTTANRFFQGYFLGGVVTGSGSTTLSDGLVSSTGGTLNLYGGGADGVSAVGLTVNTPSYSTSGAKLVSFQNNGTEKFSVDKDGTIDGTGNLTIDGNATLGDGDGELQAWASTAGPGVSRSESGYASANGYIYAIGGAGGSTSVYYTKINADGSLGTWQTTASLGTSRDQLSAVAANGYVYAIGGNGLSSVEYAKINADGSLGAWQTTSSTNSNRIRSSATVANGYIYMVGSTLNATTEYAKINADGTLGTWTVGSSLGVTRYGNAAVANNGYIYAIGGNTGSNSADVEYATLNPTTGAIGTWTSTTSMNNARNITRGVVANGHIYISGGFNVDTTEYTSINSDGTLDAWQTGTVMTDTRWGHGMITANGYIYSISGDGTTTAEYTSIPRTKVSGALDLVGFDPGSLGVSGSGGSLTAGNTMIVGTLDVQDRANFLQGVSVGQHLSVGGDLALAGALIVNSCTNTSTNILCAGGNTRAADITIGTNDSNALIFETNNTAVGRFTNTGELLINTSTNTLNAQLVVNSTAGKDTGMNIIGNVNSFYQINIQNTNSGASASSDFVATANNGTATTYYVDFGINGSGGGAAPFTGANDAYLYASDSNNLHIGALGSSGALKFYTTGGTSSPVQRLSINASGQASFDAVNSSGTGYTFNANSVTTGTALQVNATSLTSGLAFQVVGPSSKNLFRIKNDTTQPLDDQSVIIGEGGISASKPDSLARDQLYVFGRINYSWNMFTQDFLSGNPAVAADGLFMNGYYDENIGTGGTSPSGQIQMQSTAGSSGMARLTFTGTLGTGPWASNWGTGGNLVTERSLNPVFEARVQASSNTDVRHIVGFTDMALNATTSADTNNSANEVFFRKTAAGTNWEAVSRNGSGTEEVTTLATACAGSTACTTTALRTMRIELENVGANGTARFYIDGTLVATHTSTAVPANTNRLGWLLTNTPTTTTYSGRTLDMDYVRVWSDDPPSSIAPGDVGQNDGVGDNTNTTENGDTPAPEDNSNEALLGRIKTLEENVSDLNQYKDVLTTEAIGESSLKKAIFIADVEFRKQVEFSADALFKANVNVDGTLNANGRVVVSNNTGTITIQPGQNEIQVLFAKSLQGKPNVFLSTENPDVKVVAQTRTKDGFVIKLSEPITEPLDVQWFAVEKE